MTDDLMIDLDRRKISGCIGASQHDRRLLRHLNDIVKDASRTAKDITDFLEDTMRTFDAPSFHISEQTQSQLEKFRDDLLDVAAKANTGVMKTAHKMHSEIVSCMLDE